METLTDYGIVLAIVFAYLCAIYMMLKLLASKFPVSKPIDKPILTDVEKALITITLGKAEDCKGLTAVYHGVMVKGFADKMDISQFKTRGIPIDEEILKRYIFTNLSWLWQHLSDGHRIDAKIFHESLLGLIGEDGLYHDLVEHFT